MKQKPLTKDQVSEFIKSNPGCDLIDLTCRLQISTKTLHDFLYLLKKEGKIERRAAQGITYGYYPIKY